MGFVVVDRVNYIYKSNPRYQDFQNTPDDAINVLHDIKVAPKTMCTLKQTWFSFLKTCKLLTTPCCESLWTWQSREVVEPLCACTTVLFSLEIFQIFFVFEHTSTTTETIKTMSTMTIITTTTSTCVDNLACTTVGYFFRHFYQNICGVILFDQISNKPFWCWHQKNLLFRLQVFTILCPKGKKLELGVSRCLIMHQPQQQQQKRRCQNSNNNNNMCGPP